MLRSWLVNVRNIDLVQNISFYNYIIIYEVLNNECLTVIRSVLLEVQYEW